mgnify:CR=1 FL=1
MWSEEKHYHWVDGTNDTINNAPWYHNNEPNSPGPQARGKLYIWSFELYDAGDGSQEQYIACEQKSKFNAMLDFG